MNKTPYELRADALALANAHLIERFNAELHIYKINAERGVSLGKLTPPIFPSEESILKLAQTFREFIDKK